MQRARPIDDQPDHVLGLVAAGTAPPARTSATGPTSQFWTSESARTFQSRKTSAKLFVAHLRQRRIHHEDEADGDGDVRRAHCDTIDERRDARDEAADEHAQAIARKIQSVR